MALPSRQHHPKPRISGYCVVRSMANGHAAFERMVQDKIDAGWQPMGASYRGITMHDNAPVEEFFQTMIKVVRGINSLAVAKYKDNVSGAHQAVAGDDTSIYGHSPEAE